MSAMPNDEALRARVVTIVTGKYGRSDEELMASGIIDSLSAIDLALTLERELDLQADSFDLADMRSISSIVRRAGCARRSG